MYVQNCIILLGGVVMETKLNIRIETELKDKAKKYAKVKGMNISVLIRKLLIEEMEVK
jgi:antitoxin component of RelBE/YafQ-DinJ toxin-antitoxin module